MKLDTTTASAIKQSPSGDSAHISASVAKSSYAFHSAKPAGSPHIQGLPAHPVASQNQPDAEHSTAEQKPNQHTNESNRHVVTHSRPLTKLEHQVLLSQLPQSVAKTLMLNSVDANLSGSSNQTRQGQPLYLIQTSGPNGQKAFVSLKQHEVGTSLALQQKPESLHAPSNQSQSTRFQLEQWQTKSPASSPKLDDMLRQYQPIISKVVNIVVQELKQASQTTLPTSFANNAEADLTSNTASDKQAPDQSKVETHSLRYAKQTVQSKDWLVLILRSAPDSKPLTLQQSSTNGMQSFMKVPPSDPASSQPLSAQNTSAKTESTSSINTTQLQQLKSQWVEVGEVKVLEAETKQQYLKLLPEKLQASITKSDQPLYQVQLKTSQGIIQVISPAPFKTGEQIQLNIGELTQVKIPASNVPMTDAQAQKNAQAANLIQIQILQIQGLRPNKNMVINPDTGQPIHTALAHALRQYQPLKSAMQMLALQHMETNKMQALAASTGYQLAQTLSPDASKQLKPETPLSTQFHQASRINQLKQSAQQLLAGSALTHGQITKFPKHESMQPLPNALLASNQIIKAQDIQQALKQAGQELENSLQKLANLSTQTQHNESMKPDLKRGLNQINQSIQTGIKDWLKDLTGKSSTSSSSAHSTSQTSTTSSAGSSNASTLQAHSAQIKTLSDAIQNDMKAWLIQNQVQLMQVIQNDPNGKPDQKQLMDGLLKVLFPKQAGFSQQANQGEPVIPKNLSVQPHLQKVFAQLLGQQPDNGSQDESQQLRQLLSLTQNLTRLQQDQVLNRNQQVQQPDSPDFQMSLPYLQDKQIQWCELECNQYEAGNDQKKHKQGWHVILRFEQSSQRSFAIEANLIGHQLTLSLWSEEQTRLQQLNRYTDLLKQKIQKAGFVCEQIQSKHGMPAKKQRQIQQGLVDIRT